MSSNWLVCLECLGDCLLGGGGALSLKSKMMCVALSLSPLCTIERILQQNNTTFRCAEITADLEYSYMSNLSFAEIYYDRDRVHNKCGDNTIHVRSVDIASMYSMFTRVHLNAKAICTY